MHLVATSDDFEHENSYAVLPTTVPVNPLETSKTISALRHRRIPLNSLVN